MCAAPFLRPLRTPSSPEDRLLDGLIVGEHGYDRVASGGFRRAVRDGGAFLNKGLGAAFGSIVDAETVARFQEITRHRKAHVAEADKANIHCRLLLSLQFDR